MNPIDDRQHNLPPMSMRYKQENEKRSPNPAHASPRPRVPFDRLSPRSAHSDSYRSPHMEGSPQQRARSEQHFGRLHTPKPEEAKMEEDHDESAADALLSMGQPQLAIGQKRPLQQPESEETKKPKMADEEVKEEVLDEKKDSPPSSTA
jgi:hypothetical protein